MHDWLEDINKLRELLSLVCQPLEELHQGLEVPVVLIRFCPGDLNLLLKLGERASVSGFVLL